MGIETVLVTDVGRKHLVDTARWLIDQPLLGIQYLDPLCQCRTHTNHVGGNIENNGCLLTIRSTAIHFGSFFAVTAGQEQRNSGGQFRFALLFGDLNVGGIELPVAVGLQSAKHIPDDLFLPVDEFKGLSGPCAFRMTQAFYEIDRIVGGIFIVVGAFRQKTGRLVLLQFPDMRSPPMGIKNSRYRNRCDFVYEEQSLTGSVLLVMKLELFLGHAPGNSVTVIRETLLCGADPAQAAFDFADSGFFRCFNELVNLRIIAALPMAVCNENPVIIPENSTITSGNVHP